MQNGMDTTISRRGWLGRLLVAAAVAPVAGVTLADGVNADKKSKRRQKDAAPLKERVRTQEALCQLGGGTLATQKHEHGGVTTECKGGDYGGNTCFHGKKKTMCHKAAPVPTAHRPWQGDQPIHDVEPEPATDGGSTDPVME
jgi:hypothetical protein